MRPPEGSEKTGMEGYTEVHWSLQRVPNMNDFHIREMNAPLTSPFRDALRSVH